jgi:hypothetical protein
MVLTQSHLTREEYGGRVYRERFKKLRIMHAARKPSKTRSIAAVNIHGESVLSKMNAHE